MALTLQIENETSLIDGGPLHYSVSGKRGFDIGRDGYLDWTLPDPSRHISGKHCEVRFRDSAYWLHDVSTNGTYVNGNDVRMSAPHRLRNGDRIAIGHYLIRVSLDGDTAETAPVTTNPARVDRSAPGDLWSDDAATAPVAFPASARPARNNGSIPATSSDFLDWMADVPPMQFEAPIARPMPQLWSQSRDIPENTPWDKPQAKAAEVPLQPMAPILSGLDSARADTPGLRFAPADTAPSGPSNIARIEPQPQSPAKAADASDRDREIVRAFAAAAGIPEQILNHLDATGLARLLGALVRITAEELQQLLAARFEAKRMTRSSSQTQIQAVDNNPLKFMPAVEDALKLMLSAPTAGYLDAQQTLRASFADVKEHQITTYAAMQAAVQELADDFDPRKIDASVGRDGGLGHFVGSRKARAWDVFVARWDAMAVRHDNGMLGAFMEHFSKRYDLDDGRT